MPTLTRGRQPRRHARAAPAALDLDGVAVGDRHARGVFGVRSELVDRRERAARGAAGHGADVVVLEDAAGDQQLGIAGDVVLRAGAIVDGSQSSAAAQELRRVNASLSPGDRG